MVGTLVAVVTVALLADPAGAQEPKKVALFELTLVKMGIKNFRFLNGSL